MSVLLEKSDRLKPFHSWRENLDAFSNKERRFEEWIFFNASGVLLSEKTGELLSLDLSEMGLTETEVRKSLHRLSEMWGFDFRLLYQSSGLLKLILFQADRLQLVLDEAPFCIMGVELKYSFPLQVDTFFDELKSRWNESGSVPHEIGIALGYPLDDVFGYMGLLPLACKGVCGWQVYGCMEESQRLSCAFSDARCQALIFLAQTNARISA
ncbi:MAG: DUF3793 family protein [Verrucomicrobiota bacterium]